MYNTVSLEDLLYDRKLCLLMYKQGKKVRLSTI